MELYLGTIQFGLLIGGYVGYQLDEECWKYMNGDASCNLWVIQKAKRIIDNFKLDRNVQM